MKALGKGCFELIIAWAAAGYGLYYYFHKHFEAPGDLYGAIGGGMFVAMAWGMFRNVTLALKQRKLIRQSRTKTAYRDGESMVAIGTIRSLGEPIITPFRKKEGVILAYNVYCERVTHTRSSNSNSTDTDIRKDMLMGGFIMTPCAVRTPVTQVKILGFPIPTEFPEDVFLATSVREQIGEYIRNTTFGSMKGFSVSDAWKTIKNAMTEDDGSLRDEWRKESVEMEIDQSPESAYCSEQFVPNGSQVVAFGAYSASKGGMIGKLSDGGMQMFPGDEKSALAKLGGKVRSGIIISLIFALLGTLGSYGILTARENSKEVQSSKRSRLLSAVDSDDIDAARHILETGIRFSGDRDSVEKILGVVKTKEMLALLKEHGLNINLPLNGGRTALHNAVYHEDFERVKILLGAGADPNIKQREYGTLPLEIAHDAHNKEIFAALTAAGAKGLFVTEKEGKNVTANGEEVAALQKFLTAFVSRDAAALRPLVEGWPSSFFDSFANGLYDGTREEKFTFIKGYSTGDAATLFIRFKTLSPSDLWLITMINKDGVWKVRREGLDDRGAWSPDL